MPSAESSPTERLERLGRLVATLGQVASLDDLGAAVVLPFARAFGAVGARLTVDAGPDHPGEPPLVVEHGHVSGPAASTWHSFELRIGGRAVGVLELADATPPVLSDQELATVRVAASVAAQAIEHARLVDARRRADEVTSRLAFLAEVSSAVISSLELRELLDRLCEVGVPRLGDWSTILLREGVHLERCAGFHVDPAKQPLVDRLVGRFAVPLTEASPIARAFRTGEVQVVRTVDRDLAASINDELEYVDTVLELSQGSALLVPLLMRGQALGVITFALEGTNRQFDEQDIWLATEVASRGAIGIDNASRFEQEHLVAELLQRAVLPERLPDIEALDLAARYLPAGPGVEVGGDWYDAFVLDDGGVGLVIGDVAGHDVAAASTMAQLRNALRAYAFEAAEPADVLTRLNHLLCRSPDPLFATAIFGVISRDRSRFTWANAGHPPAALVRGDAVTMLGRPRGLLLGVRADHAYPQGEVELHDRDLVVLYTDGLVERRGENLQEGFDRLVAVSARAAVRGPGADAVAEQLLEALLARQARADDVCVLTAWSAGDPQPSLELDLAPRPSSSRAARGEVTATLHRWGADELADPVELLVSELVTNAVSHVGGGVHLRMEKLPVGVRVRVFDGGDEPLPEVDDEVPPDAPTGRGLLIVDNVADRWGVEPTETGKQVWFELSFDGAARRWARLAPTGG